MSPWLDLRVPPKAVKLPAVEAQTHRRFLKTHLPVDALVFSPKAKYLYIGRDGRDVVWSMYNHHANANQTLVRGAERHARPRRPADRAAAGRHPPVLARLAASATAIPFWPFWENVRSWWEIRDLPNVMLVHFADLKRDMPGRDAADRRVPRHPDRRVEWDGISSTARSTG